MALYKDRVKSKGSGLTEQEIIDIVNEEIINNPNIVDTKIDTMSVTGTILQILDTAGTVHSVNLLPAFNEQQAREAILGAVPPDISDAITGLDTGLGI